MHTYWPNWVRFPLGPLANALADGRAVRAEDVIPLCTMRVISVDVPFDLESEEAIAELELAGRLVEEETADVAFAVADALL